MNQRFLNITRSKVDDTLVLAIVDKVTKVAARYIGGKEI